MSDTKEKAKRYNSGKVEFDDVPLLGLVEVAKVSAYGRSKYAKQNWRGDAPMSQYFNCLMRHSIKCMYGEDFDDESECLHLAHIAWNALAALEKIMVERNIDDRFIYKGITNISSLLELNADQLNAIAENEEKYGNKGEDK